MKDYKQVLVIGLILTIIGVVFLVYGASINIPSPYTGSFLGIPFGVNPEYAESFQLKLALILFGTVFLGMGSGMLAIDLVVYRLECPERYAKFVGLTTKSRVSLDTTSLKYCVHCGQKLETEAVHCSKCGKKT